MKKYMVEIEDDLSDFFKGIADIAQRTVEEVLEDTLQKTVDAIMKSFDREC